MSDVFNGIKAALTDGSISMDRLNDAVARVIAVKLALGSANLQTSLKMQPRTSP